MTRAIVLLGVVWVAATGDASVGSIAFGLLLGGLVLLVSRPLGYPVFRKMRPLKLAGLLAFLAWEIVVANLRVVAAVLGPRRLLRPAVVAVPLDVTSDAQIVVLSNLVSLTPGTLSLDVSPDHKTLYVHTMSTSSPEALREEIKQGFERRVREAIE